MKLHDFVTELKRRNVCKVAIVYGVVASLFITTRRFAALELARVLVPLDYVARFIVNANHSIM
jgi:hypothetical protein